MPMAAKKPCRHPGCGELVSESGYCPAHKKAAQQRQDAKRGTAHQRGYGYRWQQTSAGFLRSHPLCECEECVTFRAWWESAPRDADGAITEEAMRSRPPGELRKSEVTDHKVPHRGDMKLFWNRGNWQAMAKYCHDRKTAREDGGFGRA